MRWTTRQRKVIKRIQWALIGVLVVATVGFTCLFAAVVLMRMRALLADVQAEARLRRRAREAA